MKKFILQQDECGISPQLILSNMRHIFDIISQSVDIQPCHKLRTVLCIFANAREPRIRCTR
ncbi:hypothetical protein GQ600_11064 [Phytophthora cactorum]|nr:hypothetical protein GQ600_11064 [Phytophthora cactorum]